MDRAWVVRYLFRPLLLAAVSIQALTPDFLDYALLSQSLPPGPLFLISSLSIPSRLGNEDDAFFPEGFFALPEAVLSDRDVADGTPDHLCQPIWPEVGVNQSRVPGSPARPKFRLDPGPPSIVRIDMFPTVRVRIPLPRVAELPLLLCRFLC